MGFLNNEWGELMKIRRRSGLGKSRKIRSFENGFRHVAHSLEEKTLTLELFMNSPETSYSFELELEEIEYLLERFNKFKKFLKTNQETNS